MMKDILEKMVAEEIRSILEAHKPSIKEMVKTSLLPQLKTAIREEVKQCLEKFLEQSPETIENPIAVPGINNSAFRNPQSKIQNPKSKMGLYLYAIADGADTMDFGGIGLDGSRVYTIAFGDFSAVVHDCKAVAYQSEDRDRVKAWVLTHQKVVDTVLEKFGTVIPMGFDTIISGKGDSDPEGNMGKWIETDSENLASKMAKIRGKAEYGVQIFWETHAMAHDVSEKSAEIKSLQREIQTKPKGIAYMVRQKLEELLKNEMARKADQCFQEFYEKIKVHTDDLRVEKTKYADDEGRQMLLNLSCLLSKGQSEKLGEALEEIDNREGFSVRYTGPWPPYSFV
ncbi:MAG: GvpL/GvpF family gas vesicle protein [Deltaproteobacteria bacterium]|nr:GvpL/GvpF family gas vesicle protein [Deltaproteobacteria bacterium]